MLSLRAGDGLTRPKKMKNKKDNYMAKLIGNIAVGIRFKISIWDIIKMKLAGVSPEELKEKIWEKVSNQTDS
jgi:hypothetical protein